MHELERRDRRLRTVAIFGMRAILGLIFFWQGFGKVFSWGMERLWANVFSGYADTFLPEALVRFTMYFTSYAELICGAALILGFARERAYYILLSVLLIVTFGHGLERPIWDLHHVIFRAVLLIPLMFIPLDWDRWSLDRMIFRQ